MNRILSFLALPATVTVLALSITGCVISPDLINPDLPSPEAAVRARADAIRTQPGLTAHSSAADWWTLFGDTTLTELEKIASKTNLDLLAAVARVDESRAQLGLVDSARRPQFSANSEYVRSALSENSPDALLGAPTAPSSTWKLGLQASWELDLWGHLRHQSESANAQLQATAYGMEDVKISVTGDVARTYLLLRGTQSKIRIVDENRQIAKNLVKLTESRQSNGIATRYDVAAASADVAGIEARLVQLSQQRDALMNALALLLAKPPRELNSTLGNATMPVMPARLPVSVPSELARNRPDILQADARLRAAVANIGAAEADFYPRISLTGNVGVQAFEFSDLGSWSSRTFSIGPSLYLPIFQGGRLRNNLKLSEARQRLAGITYQQTVLRAWHEVDDALNAYATELKRHEQLQLAVDQNKAALNVANRSYQQGTADFTSVLVARRTLLVSESDLTDCITASALSVVSLYRALGGGWSPALQSSSPATGSAS